jgi:5-methylcytosine-specific restriction enzyme A
MPRLFQRCNERSCVNRTNERGGYCPEHKTSNQRARQQSDRGHHWYGWAIWREVKEGFRLKYPERACVCQWLETGSDGVCGQTARIIDHVIPFRGSWELFIGGVDFDNLQGLCQRHHNQKTAEEGQEVAAPE